MELLSQRFQDHGIDTEQMCVRKNRTTNFDIVISDEGSMGRSFVFIQETQNV